MKKLQIFVASLLIILAGCNKQDLIQENTVKNNSSIKEEIDKTHIFSEELNFKINLPKSLSNCKIEKTYNDKNSTVKIKHIFTFSLPTNNYNWPNKNGYVKFLDIYIYELPDWQTLLNSGNYIPSHLKTTKEYVYAYDITHVLPSDIEIIMSDIKKIVESFSLIVDNEIEPLKPMSENETPQGD